MRQMAYARRVWGAKGPDKMTIALDVGYSPSVSRSVVSKIESRKGFNNAIARLAAESNNVALAAIHEFKARGFADFNNAELTKALSAIAGAWEKFNKGMVEQERPEDNGKNRLRTVVLQNINKQVNVPDNNTQVISALDNAVEGEVVGRTNLDF